MENCKPKDITRAVLASYAKEQGYEQSYMNAQDAAEFLGVTRPRITQLCNQGKLSAIMLGKCMYIPIDQLKRYYADNHWEELTGMEGC